MTVVTSSPPSLGTDEQALAQYRSINKLALVALVLGPLCALVLVNPLLSPIPLVTIAVSLFSLRQIRSSGGQMLGRTPAVAGLCLAMLFLGWGLAARFGRSLELEGRARQIAEGWLKLVAQGDLQQADQLRAPAHTRMRSAAGRKEFYAKNANALATLNTFFDAPVLRDFRTQGPNVKFQFDSIADDESSTLYDRLTLKYTFGGDEQGTSAHSIWITVKRQVEEDYIDWLVENVSGEPGLRR